MSDLLKNALSNLEKTESLEKPVVPQQKESGMSQAIMGAYKEQMEDLTPEALEWKKSTTDQVNFTKYDKNLEKLQSYGGKFQKYGYNPHIDNEAFYDDMTTTSEQWVRSLKGAGKLTNIGITDNLLFGAFADKDSHKDYAQVADWYTSSKGGATGFMQNLVMNAGYTVGIMGDMLAEEAALAGITALTFGASAPVTVTAMGIKATQTANALRKVYNTFHKGSKILKAAKNTKKGLSMAQKAGNFFNPIGNTLDFAKALRSADDLKDVSKIGKSMMGVGAVFRDVKAAHLSWTEASLEGNMMYDDVYENLVSNHKGPLTKDDADRYRQQANSASTWAKGENMIAIGATNKLVFNNMYKAFDNLKGLGKVVNGNKFFEAAYDGTKANLVRKGLFNTGSRTKMVFADGFGKGLRRTAKGISRKGGTYFSANLGEGFQELAQETINAKNTMMYSSPEQGDYFESVLHGLKEQFTGQGAETFLSGFLMGSLMTPINAGVKQVTEFKDGGYKYFTDNKNYKKDVNTERDRLEADVKLINEIIQTPGDVFKAQGNNLGIQASLDEEMSDALVEGDQYKFQNAKGESYRNHLHAMMRNNMMDEFIDNLSTMKNLDSEQFAEAFPSADKNLTQAQRDVIIDKQMKAAENFKEHYDYVQKNVKSPVDVSRMDKNDPNYISALIYNDYFEKAKEELIFSKAEFQNNVERWDSILEKTRKNFDNNTSGEINFAEYEKLYHPEKLKEEIGLLTHEVKNLTYDEATPKEQKEQKEKSKKLNALIEFDKSLEEMNTVIESIEELRGLDPSELRPKDKKALKGLESQHEKIYKKAYKAHNAYLQTLAPTIKDVAFDNLSEESFDLLYDSYRLKNKNKELDHFMNVLTNENMLNEIVKDNVRRNSILMDQFKHYVRNSLKDSRNKATVEKGLNTLYSKGIGFNMEHLDKLVDKGVMPPVFYDLETGEVIPRKVSIKDKKGDVVGEENNKKYDLAVEITNAMYDDVLDKPTDKLKESSEEEISKAEKKQEEKSEEDSKEEVEKAEYVPTEEDDVTVSEDDEIQSYPKALLNSLIEKYKKEVEAENNVDPNVDSLDVDNLTSRFETWVEDSQEAHEIIKNHNESIKAEIPKNSEIFTNSEKMKLREAGYETEEGLNNESTETLREVLDGGSTQAVDEVTLTKVEVYRTSDTFSSKVDNAQRGSGAYYGMDKPFTEGGSKESVSKVSLEYDTAKSLDATTVEGQEEFMDIKMKAVEGKDFKSIEEKNEAVKEAMLEAGYTSLTGWIEEDNQEAGRELVLYTEVEETNVIPEVVNQSDEYFEDTKDEGISYRETRAKRLIAYARTKHETISEEDDFYNDIVAVEKIILENLGGTVYGYAVTKDVIQDIYNVLEKYDQATESGLQQFAVNLDGKIYDMENPNLAEEAKVAEEQKIAKLRGLKYTAKDIEKLSEKEIKNILENEITKLNYIESLKSKKDTKHADHKRIKEYLKTVDTNLRTEEELVAMLAEMSIEESELFDKYPEVIKAEVDSIKLKLIDLKGFKNLKPGDIVEMQDGSLMKVDKLLKTKVELVNYNNIIQNRTSLTKAQFNKQNKRVVNDFNKNSKGLVSKLEKQNVDDLSSILSNFTGGVLMSSEEIPTEQELKDHFKLCK